MFSCSDSTSVSAEVRAVDLCASPVDATIRICDALEGLQNAQPRSISFPTSQAVMTGAPRAVLFGDISPRRAEFDAPDDAVDDTAMVQVLVITFRVAGEMGLECVPLGVCKVSSARQAQRLRSTHEFSYTDSS